MNSWITLDIVLYVACVLSLVAVVVLYLRNKEQTIMEHFAVNEDIALARVPASELEKYTFPDITSAYDDIVTQIELIKSTAASFVEARDLVKVLEEHKPTNPASVPLSSEPEPDAAV
jgi:hypothetical protein